MSMPLCVCVRVCVFVCVNRRCLNGHSAPQAVVCVWKGMDPPPGVQGGDACECPNNTPAAVCPRSTQPGVHGWTKTGAAAPKEARVHGQNRLKYPPGGTGTARNDHEKIIRANRVKTIL